MSHAAKAIQVMHSHELLRWTSSSWNVPKQWHFNDVELLVSFTPLRSKPYCSPMAGTSNNQTYWQNRKGSFVILSFYCVWMDHWSWSKSDFNSRLIASQATPCNHVSMTRKLNMVLMIQLTTRWQTSRWSGAQGEIHSKCMRRLQGDITAGAAALKSWQSLLQAEPARRRDQ